MDKNDYIGVVHYFCGPSRFSSVNANWVKAIIDHESSWDPETIRYEPHYPYLYHPDRFTRFYSLETETVAQKMSWGLGQIMGALAREQGLNGSIGQLLNPNVNISHLCKRVDFLMHYSSDPGAIFAMYNGGPGALQKEENGKFKNQAYVDTVLAYLQNYEK